MAADIQRVDRDDERELDAVISEEKAKIVLGDGYSTLPFVDWVDELGSFVATQICADCGRNFDLDDPEQEVWGWFHEHNGEEVEELEVVKFFCVTCIDMDDDEREAAHPKTWGMLIFRRPPTGTFPDDDNEIDLDG